MKGTNSGKYYGWEVEGVNGDSVPYAQICSEPKLALKIVY